MRLLVVLLLAATFATELPAQRPRPSVGAQVGYSRSDIGGPDADQIGSRQGALSGVFLHFPVTRALAVRPELLFSLKGGGTLAPLEDGGGTIPLDFELAYLELPVLAHLSPAIGRYRPVIFAGPAPALQIGCDVELGFQSGPQRLTCNEAGPTFRGWDLGLVAGAGVEAHLSRSTLALEARYTTGVRSIVDDFRASNRTFALLLALTF
ncbi:MAG TPA: porin family protein [Gemmatimonadales bacterium]|nr:porin family protein [Gemmatimonadales bacterium]